MLSRLPCTPGRSAILIQVSKFWGQELLARLQRVDIRLRSLARVVDLRLRGSTPWTRRRNSLRRARLHPPSTDCLRHHLDQLNLPDHPPRLRRHSANSGPQLPEPRGYLSGGVFFHAPAFVLDVYYYGSEGRPGGGSVRAVGQHPFFSGGQGFASVHLLPYFGYCLLLALHQKVPSQFRGH